MAQHTPFSSSRLTYGKGARIFHWLTALLILTAIPLGVIANDMPYDTSEQLARKAFVFSLHKTLGLAAFFTALARIAWAITQPRPAPLHPERKLETFAAETVHWTLYGAMVLVPVTGWIHHAATVGFAPIYWPFGQNLPFVPKDAEVAHLFAILHMVFERVLILAVLLHIAGALKHVIIDRDLTLARMWRGGVTEGLRPMTSKHLGPATAALMAYGGALALAFALGYLQPLQTPARADLAAAPSEWAVQSGELRITVSQFGAEVSGVFTDWTAQIDFDPAQNTGAVQVKIATGSLDMGSLTGNALAPSFIASDRFPIATFSGPITRAEDSYEIQGQLELRGLTVPVTLPFDLEITEKSAKAAGSVFVDRRDFDMGPEYTDEATVGFTVRIDFSLEAAGSI